MPWNPGLSYTYAAGAGGGAAAAAADGYFATVPGSGDAVVRLRFRWTGDAPPASPAVASAEPVSFWYRGAAYRNVRPEAVQREAPGVVWWGVFPVGEPTPGATAADVLADHNAGAGGRGPPDAPGTRAGWDAAALALRPGAGAATHWLGTVPADRRDWLDFVRRIPLTAGGDDRQTTAAVRRHHRPPGFRPIVGRFHHFDVAAFGLPAHLAIGEWHPAAGFAAGPDGDVVFEWAGRATVAERARALATPAVFWHAGGARTALPLELLPDVAGRPLRGRFALLAAPPLDDAIVRRAAGVVGCWDAALRVDANRAAVVWAGGGLPCAPADAAAFLMAQPALLSLDGQALLPASLPLAVDVSTAAGGLIVGLFAVPPAAAGAGAAAANADVQAAVARMPTAVRGAPLPPPTTAPAGAGAPAAAPAAAGAGAGLPPWAVATIVTALLVAVGSGAVLGAVFYRRHRGAGGSGTSSCRWGG